MSSFNDDLREAVLIAIGNIDLSRNRLVEAWWSNSAVRILKQLVAERVVEENELLANIHLRLLRLGRKSYDNHKKVGSDPDHTYSPNSLAYALQNGEFDEEERLSIKFDGETEAEFIAFNNKGDLRQDVLTQMLTEREPVDCGPDDTHCLCC